MKKIIIGSKGKSRGVSCGDINPHCSKTEEKKKRK
jgi:hypothetical protein